LDDSDRLTITFRDGGPGDLDGIANAVIVDPGGLGAPADVADGTAPVVECGSPDAAWHPEDVSIACTARDDESGLANPADAAFSLTTRVPAGEEFWVPRSTCAGEYSVTLATLLNGSITDSTSATLTVVR
jgi:hypothetical protein